jgi:CBS-domain-containing membrane protein
VTARPETHIKDLIKDIVEAGLHRVWVLDADNKPSGVVSLRDIIDSFLVTVV